MIKSTIFRLRVGRLARALALLLAGLCCTAFPAHAEDEKGEARVLILNGTDAYLPAYLIADNAMRATFSNEGARRVVLFAEALDAQRFPIETVEAEFLALLTKKYSALRVDVVVAFGRPALEFFIRHGQQLWPGARLVFEGFVGDNVGLPALPINATGVMAPEDVRGTIDLARRMQPKAQRMMVITGVADLDKRYERLARIALSTGTEGISVDFVSGLPQEELIARVAALPADTIVIFLSQFRDRAGRPYSARELLRQVSKASAAPVYGIAGTLMGTGAVAGVVESLEDRGRLVAEQVLAALAGGASDPSRVLLQTPTRCVADARALQRWSLDERRLPSGCDLEFIDRPFWREYFWVGLSALAVMAGQALLITALLFQRARRRYAEREAKGLSGRLLTAHEDERRRLARELHDDLTQRLARLAIDAGKLEQAASRDGAATMRNDLVRLSEDVHSLSYRLHPSVLDDLGLVEALKAECDRVARQGTLRVEVDASGVANKLSADASLCLFRVAQEALNNVARHAHATAVTVQLAPTRNGMQLVISDNGQGFNAETRKNGSLGLASMRERVRLLHGELDIESTPGRGTTVVASVPV